ncbi:glucose-6-phosphate dehydrogenase assembly protein OpcA [Synechococcus elongatus]|uniref:Glucose-6-phosphate dehydrogenase assembly protein OpcA n=1 Tax=Synechococcus elongatus PCC 11801 TaxID=2219813 RepID=A0AAQ3RDB1_SYNEL
MTTATPLLSLQKPTPIALAEIEESLSQLWANQQHSGAGTLVSRATTFSIVVYEPEEFQQILAALGLYHGHLDGLHGPVTRAAIAQAQTQLGLPATGRPDSATLKALRQAYQALQHPPSLTNQDLRGAVLSNVIATQNPCRIVSLCPTLESDRPISAEVSAYCPITSAKQASLICCEAVTLRGSREEMEAIGSFVSELLLPGLPRYVWWKATPNPEQVLFQQLASSCNCMIFDSSYFSDPEAEFLRFQDLIDQETYIADLNWHRLAAWQELTAAAFDPPERRDGLLEVDQLVIDYEKGNPAQALMYMGWIASRLGWQPVTYRCEGGEYDLREIEFRTEDDRTVKVELAGIPVGDPGLVLGDLIALRLTSENPDADCCTILCSETTGCMRMEAGGSAQSCRTEQVAPPSNETSESLLAMQMQRWGRDALYEESLAVIAAALRQRTDA